MKRYKSQIQKEEIIVKTKEKINEASFTVNNIGSAQNNLIGIIELISKIKPQPYLSGNIIGESLITGLDSMFENIEDENLKNKKKQIVVKTILRSLLSYRKSLV